MPNEKCWIYVVFPQKIYFGTYFQEIMAKKRKSVLKHPSRRRRNRSSTPALDLLSPYLPGPELFISSPISAIQTRSAHSSARANSSLSGASFSSIGHAPYSGSNPTLSFDSNPIPPNSNLFPTKSGVVQDLSVRSATQSVLPLQIDWYGVQRFFQEFRLPDFTLDSFSGRLLDVVSSTTFSSDDVQVELCHAITRLMAFCIYIL